MLMSILSRTKHTVTSSRPEPKLRVAHYAPWHDTKAALETALAHTVDPSSDTPLNRALSAAIIVNPRSALHHLEDKDLGLHASTWHQGSSYYVAITGEPEAVIARSDLTDTERERAILKSRQLASSAHLVIAVAELHAPQPMKSLAAINRLSFLGFVSFEDTRLY